jgi:hypothetical protein
VPFIAPVEGDDEEGDAAVEGDPGAVDGYCCASAVPAPIAPVSASTSNIGRR